MVGEPGAGVKTIMDMVTLTRLDCAVASSAIMRAGLAEAVHHARHRQVFGTTADRPAADAARAGRHGARRRRRHRAVVPAGALLRRGGQRPRRGGVCPRHDAGRQILGLQDRAAAALRGDGMPRRQWLCRGGAARPLLSRGAGQRDLGRLRQRHGARRAARAWRVRPDLFDEVLAGIERRSRRRRAAALSACSGRPCRSPRPTRARRAS